MSPKMTSAFFLFGGSIVTLSVKSLYIDDIYTADGSFDLFLDRYIVKDLIVTDQAKDLRSDLCFDNGKP